MAFKKYQIFIFDEKTGSRRTLYFKSVFFSTCFLIFCLLIAGNVFLGIEYVNNNFVQAELNEIKLKNEDKDAKLLELLAELNTLQEDIERIRQFNNKLQVLAGKDSDANEVSNIGGIGNIEVDMLPLHRQDLAARKIHSFIDQLKKDVQLEEVAQQDLILFLRENANKLASTPSIWPVEGGFVTSNFGMRTAPFTGVRRLHKGIDISAPIGTPVVAPARGKVIFAGNDGAYGLSVEIDHGSGIITRYAHLNKFHVKKGDLVERGHRFADVGNTGRSTGPHLHYEVVVNGIATNPNAYLLKD